VNRVGFAIGLGFGFLITAARLNDYDVIHRMLLIQELDVYLLMASAVATAMPLLLLLQRTRWRTPLGGPLKVARAPVRPRNILGATVFGTGWAVAGTCPGPALAMPAAGGILGVFVMAGLFVGAVLRDAVDARRSTRQAAAAESRLVAASPNPTPATQSAPYPSMTTGVHASWMDR